MSGSASCLMPSTLERSNEPQNSLPSRLHVPTSCRRVLPAINASDTDDTLGGHEADDQAVASAGSAERRVGLASPHSQDSGSAVRPGSQRRVHVPEAGSDPHVRTVSSQQIDAEPGESADLFGQSPRQGTDPRKNCPARPCRIWCGREVQGLRLVAFHHLEMEPVTTLDDRSTRSRCRQCSFRCHFTSSFNRPGILMRYSCAVGCVSMPAGPARTTKEAHGARPEVAASWKAPVQPVQGDSAQEGEQPLQVASRLHAFNQFELKYLVPVEQAHPAEPVHHPASHVGDGDRGQRAHPVLNHRSRRSLESGDRLHHHRSARRATRTRHRNGRRLHLPAGRFRDNGAEGTHR